VKFLRRGNLQRGEGTRTSDELEGLGNALVVGRHVGRYQGRVNWGLAMVVEEEGRLTQGVVGWRRFEVRGGWTELRREAGVEWRDLCYQVVRSGSGQCPAAVCIGLGIFRHCEYLLSTVQYLALGKKSLCLRQKSMWVQDCGLMLPNDSAGRAPDKEPSSPLLTLTFPKLSRSLTRNLEAGPS
jgi:hypothetical protein